MFAGGYSIHRQASRSVEVMACQRMIRNSIASLAASWVPLLEMLWVCRLGLSKKDSPYFRYAHSNCVINWLFCHSYRYFDLSNALTVVIDIGYSR